MPAWWGWLNRSAASAPRLELPRGEKECIEPTQYMRTSHVDLLNDWKESAVREGRRTYVASTGKEYTISLTNTCMVRCHTNKATFCDRCHDYMNVHPWCWDCHNFPKEAGK